MKSIDNRVRSCEKISWRAKAPAPRKRKSFRINVGQALSSISPAIVLAAGFSCLIATAQTVPATLRVTNEIAPPGGMAQVKVLLTSPKPITTGSMDFDMPDGDFDSIDGIAMFSPTGDVAGAAVVNSSRFTVQAISPNGTFGAATDYPLMTAAVRLSTDTVAGQKWAVNLDPSASIWRDLAGAPISFEFQQGSITVGGSVSITNVLPGGGMLAPGSSFRVLGLGFSPKTKLSVRGLNTTSIQYVSPTEFRVTVHEGGMLDGTMIQVQNPDNSIDTYYSYMRGVPVGQSSRTLLSRTVPIFSILTATEAVLPSTISPLVNADYFTGIALQNPNAAPADITIEARSAAGAVTGSTVVTLPAGYRISREASELFGAVLPTGSYMHVASTAPVQVLGLLGNDQTQVVLPIAANIISGPVPPPPPVPGPSGGGGGGKGK